MNETTTKIMFSKHADRKLKERIVYYIVSSFVLEYKKLLKKIF